MKLNYLLTTTVAALVLTTVAQAAAIAPSAYFFNKKANIKTVQLDGGSASMVKWAVSAPSQYQVFVTIPNNVTAKNAVYRIYPRGKGATTDDSCTTTQKNNPCYEITVDPSANQGKEIQLTAGNKNVWRFNKKGFVSISASNLQTGEILSTGYVRFSQPTAPQSSFSKVANNGSILTVDAVLGAGVTDWACTKDNNTGLVWEAKPSDTSLTSRKYTYSWYDSNPKTNGGFAGYQNLGECPVGVSCDTEGYIKAVNAAKLCGYDDWRLPTAKEFMNLVDMSFLNWATFTGAIDPTYFPASVPIERYWTSDTTAENVTHAAFVILAGAHGTSYKMLGKGLFNVRLVRGK